MTVAAVQGQVISVHCLVNKDETNSNEFAIDLFLFTFNIEGIILCVLCLNSIFGYCADVYENSRECIKMLNHLKPLRRSKLLKRMVWSMPRIRINFGKTNFVDRLSPVVYQQYTNDKIIEMLMLRK